MAVELGGVSVHGVADVSVRERTRLAHHPVPGGGDVVQVLGRGAIEVSFAGICYGPDAAGQLQRLREAQMSGEPLDFFADAVGEGVATRVVVGALDVRQRAGRLDELGFRCTVTEYVDPPRPGTEQDGLFGTGIDDVLRLEALDFLDGIQDTLTQVGGLTGLLAGTPSFGDPTARLSAAVDVFTGAAGAGPALLDAVRQEVLGDAAGGVPGFAELVTATGAATSRAGALAAAVRGLAPGGAGSPLAPLADALAELRQLSTVDVTGLTAGLPASLRSVDSVLRPASIELVESIGPEFGAASDALAGHPLLVAAGDRPVADALLGVLDGVADGLAARLTENLARLVRSDSVAALAETLAAIERMRTSFPEHAGELVPFLAENLTGLPPTLLGELRQHATTALSIVDRIDGMADDARLAGPSRVLAESYTGVVLALDALDPAGSYDAVLAALDAVETAAGQVTGGLTQVYDAVGVDSHDWAGLLDYRDPLVRAADAAAGGFTLDDIVHDVTGILERVAVGVSRVFDAEELARRGRELTGTIHALVTASPLARIRDILAEFAGGLVTLIERVPLDEIGGAVDDLLRRARSALDELGIDDVATRIEQAFAAVDRFVQDRLSDAVVAEVRRRAADLVAQVPAQPVTDVLAGVGRVADAAGTIVTGLADAGAARLDQLAGLTDGLERLDFTPITDAVIAELDEIRDRLRAMRADALSDGEKLAIRVGLATLRALDVRGEVVAEVTAGYDRLDAALRSAVTGVRGGVEELSGILSRLQPANLLAPLLETLDEVAATARRVSARALVVPLRDRVRELAGELAKVRPGDVLEPLRAPHADVTRALGRLDPDNWLRPLRDVWRRIDETLARLDVRTALTAVDERQRALLDSARQSILDTLDDLRLPEPVATFVTGLRPAIEAMTGALLAAPDTLVPDVLLRQPVRQQVAALLALLDDVWQRVIDLLSAAPEAAVTAAIEELRAGVGVLAEIDPDGVIERVKRARDTFADATPELFLGPVHALTTLRARFEFAVRDAPPERQDDIAAVLARFADVEAKGRTPGLTQRHAELAGRFAAAVSTLDPAPLVEPYTRLRAQVERLVPAFLRDREPLDRAGILGELAALRPSVRVEHLDAAISRLLTRVEELRAGLDPVVGELFAALRAALDAIGPAALARALDEVYAAARAKLAAIDPGVLAERVDAELFEPLAAALAAVDPARLGARLDASYTAAVHALSTRVDEVLDAVAGVLDEPLRQLGAGVAGLAGQLRAAVTTTGAALASVLDRLRELDLVTLLDRLPVVLDRLRASFRAELGRVVRAFDEMLAAIPGAGGRS